MSLSRAGASPLRPVRALNLVVVAVAALALGGGLAAGTTVAAAASLVGKGVPAASAAATPGPPAPLSGVYIGAADSGDTQAFASWRGSSVTVVSDYLSHNGDWSGLQNPAYWLNAWAPTVAKGVPLVLGVPMIAAGGDTFQAGAAGAYDSYYRTLAQDLVNSGEGNTMIRLGWEFNGNWDPWSVTPTGADSPANFVADWQHTVSVMRAIAPNLKFVWNVNDGANPSYAVSSTYPGDNYVDYVGVDSYDNASWSAILSPNNYGLDYWAAFAKQHGKLLAIPEWGLAGSDDPTYISEMYQWMKANVTGFECFYDYQNQLNEAPKSAAEYQTLYSS